MAGAFGYEAEHYEVSMQVGELDLFPYIREKVPSPLQGSPTGVLREGARGEGFIAASGTSCRAQIADGTGAQALHPIQIVAELLNNFESREKHF
jgi:Fe-S oxidoreductase